MTTDRFEYGIKGVDAVRLEGRDYVIDAAGVWFFRVNTQTRLPLMRVDPDSPLRRRLDARRAGLVEPVQEPRVPLPPADI